MNPINLLYVDLFCGAGGTSTGVNTARLGGAQCARVIACVNHDAKAIASHAANHPDALHFTEDIRTLELSPLVAHVNRSRAEHPEARVALWASLECTNFSRAKGGQPRDADSRTLAEHLFRYIEALNPDYIQIENVEEFRSWGALDANGRPVSKDRGRSYVRWVNKVKSYGYDYDCRIMNAADYGAYTSRKRFFGIFARKGLPIAFPEQTHSRRGDAGLFGILPKWRPVREVLDFDDEGESIFGRKKPLAENTLKRIYAGLIKFVAGGSDAFLVKYNSMSRNGRYVPPSLDAPCPVVATQSRLARASVHFLSKQYGGAPADKNIPVDGAVTTNPKHHLVTVRRHYLMNPQFASAGSSVDAPCFTLIARMDKRPPFLVTTEHGGIAVEIYDTDSPMTVKIKEFMALYCIVDIKMRMFKISELKLITGFPEDYILIGTQADQKKFIGNAVEVTIARKWCEALCQALSENGKQTKAA